MNLNDLIFCPVSAGGHAGAPPRGDRGVSYDSPLSF